MLTHGIPLRLLLAAICLHGANTLRGADVPAALALSLIPRPAAVHMSEGVFSVMSTTSVVAAGEAEAEARKLIDALAPAMGFRLQRVEGVSPAAGAIVLALDETARTRFGAEGYTLRITPKRIDLRAAESAGLFYAIQTLRQLLPASVFSPKHVEEGEWTVPCLTIADRPRFAWRGLLIDPARHFIPVADVKHFIAAMALHKFNRLQIHLTDNEGWRIEIRKYPKLTELGSRMDWNLRYKEGEGRRCFGYYTQDDIRELVRYAAECHVTIIPEIEMPYHAGAVIVAYPQHGVNMRHLADLSSDERWGRKHSWRPNSGLLGARPETVRFMQDILAEVIQLFPGRFIHIGGDEASMKVWTDDPEMQARMRELGCEDAHELHSWFIKQMDGYLASHGRRMVGWDEILQGGLAPGATVMSWRGTGGGITAAKAGHDVVMAPTSHTYFDYRQHPEESGLGRSVLSVEKVYAFEPIPSSLKAEQAKHILGGQGQLWGELIADAQRRDFMAWPRACALAETLWSRPEGRNLDLFLPRLDLHLERLRAAGIGYRALDKQPILRQRKADPAGSSVAPRGNR